MREEQVTRPHVSWNDVSWLGQKGDHETTRKATVVRDSAASRTRVSKFAEATRYQRVISQDHMRAAIATAVVVTVC